MSLRAVLIGSVGALLIAGFGYYNNQELKLEAIESGHQIPVAVIGLLIVAVLTVNPLLFAIRRRFALRPAEGAIIVMMMLVACSVPGRGFLEQFTQAVAMPAHWGSSDKGWQRHKLMEYVPPAMFPADAKHDREVLDGFLRGMGKKGAPIGLDRIPWGKWRGPLITWSSLAVLLGIASICLCLIVHRQWSVHERLRYPIAEFASALLERDPDRPVGGLFSRKLFWIGLGVVFSIRLINGLNIWAEGQAISVPLTFNFSAIARKFPLMTKVQFGGGLAWPTIYPLVVGFSFFLAADISFSLGISQYLAVGVGMVLFTYGVNMSTSYMAGGVMGWNRAGAYIASALMVTYVGRHYYGNVLKSALTFRCRGNIEPYAAWAARIGLLSLVAATGIMIYLGLDWPLAVLTVSLIMVMFLGVSRITAESGLFLIHPRWQPMGVLLGLFGGYALGVEGIIVCGILCALLCIDASQALMPYFLTGLRLCSREGIRPGRTGCLAGSIFVVALGVGIVAALWVDYNYGTQGRNNWTHRRVPTMAFRPALAEAGQLSYTGRLEESDALGPVERLMNIRPSKVFLWSAGTGFALVLLVSAIRLRFPWWPLHPVAFMVWATWAIVALHHSFLLGWLLRVVVTRFGGFNAYRKCKPLMIGVIAGEVLAALMFLSTGAIYHFITDAKLPAVLWLPR